MVKRDNLVLVVVSILTIVLIVGFIYKTAEVLFSHSNPEQLAVDSTLVKKYYEQIKTGPASVELDPSKITHPEAPKNTPGKEITDQASTASSENNVERAPQANLVLAVGTFSSKNNAEDYVKDLRKKNLSGHIHHITSRGLFIVYVREFSDYDNAKLASAELTSMGVENYIKKISVE